MNNIPQEQNTQRKLELLAAQRQLYSDAKNLQLISLIIAVPIVIVCSILVAVFPQLAVYNGLLGIIATFLEIFVFSPFQKSTQEKAAKIQQIFDCEVLQFNWTRLNCGIPVERELVIDASNRYKRKHQNYSVLQNWYPISVGQLPIDQARIICQRFNVWWDAKLRRRYSKGIIVILVVLTIIVLLIGLIRDLTLEKFLLAVLAPLLPAFVLGLRQYTENNEAAVRLDGLHENAEILLYKAICKKLTQPDLEIESYNLQIQIYHNRCRNPLIFDWIYSFLRNKQEEQMNICAESIVEEFINNP